MEQFTNKQYNHLLITKIHRLLYDNDLTHTNDNIIIDIKNYINSNYDIVLIYTLLAYYIVYYIKLNNSFKNTIHKTKHLFLLLDKDFNINFITTNIDNISIIINEQKCENYYLSRSSILFGFWMGAYFKHCNMNFDFIFDISSPFFSIFNSVLIQRPFISGYIAYICYLSHISDIDNCIKICIEKYDNLRLNSKKLSILTIKSYVYKAIKFTLAKYNINYSKSKHYYSGGGIIARKAPSNIHNYDSEIKVFIDGINQYGIKLKDLIINTTSVISTVENIKQYMKFKITIKKAFNSLNTHLSLLEELIESFIHNYLDEVEKNKYKIKDSIITSTSKQTYDKCLDEADKILKYEKLIELISVIYYIWEYSKNTEEQKDIIYAYNAYNAYNDYNTIYTLNSLNATYPGFLKDISRLLYLTTLINIKNTNYLYNDNIIEIFKIVKTLFHEVFSPDGMRILELGIARSNAITNHHQSTNRSSNDNDAAAFTDDSAAAGPSAAPAAAPAAGPPASTVAPQASAVASAASAVASAASAAPQAGPAGPAGPASHPFDPAAGVYGGNGDDSITKLNEIITTTNFIETIKNIYNIPYTKAFPLETIKDKEINEHLKTVKNMKKKIDKGFAIKDDEKKKYDESIQKLVDINNDESNKVIDYVKDNNIIIDEKKIIKTDKTIIEFVKISDIFKLILIGLTILCIIIYIIVVIISVLNVINLGTKIIYMISNILVNETLSYSQTLSYGVKQIINCTKDNYTDDILNVINEQSASLSVFNITINMTYILLGYIIIYILAVIYANINSFTHILHGNIKDIDPEFELLTIIGIIFVISFIHLLIYKFIFKSISYKKFKTLHAYEVIIDEEIISKLTQPKLSMIDFTKFYTLLKDPSKRIIEIDKIFANFIPTLSAEIPNNFIAYLLLYNIYMYFEEHLFTSEKKRVDIETYLTNIIQSKKEDNSPTFISFLDSNERKLIKLYHEELPFYSQISGDDLTYYKKINDNVASSIGAINKSILQYNGTFYPFFIVCIYIIGICLYNLICMYIIFRFILGNKKQNPLFPNILYSFAERYNSICIYMYNKIIK
jgi:hypothetical protein